MIDSRNVESAGHDWQEFLRSSGQKGEIVINAECFTTLEIVFDQDGEKHKFTVPCIVDLEKMTFQVSGKITKSITRAPE